MAKARADVVRLAFNAGKWAPKMEARVDLEKGQFACRELRNITLFQHGGTKRRPGTRYIGTAPAVTGPYLATMDGSILATMDGGLLKTFG